MNENVKNVNDDGEFITVNREDYNRLRQERDEYRSIALELRERIKNTTAIFQKGGATIE